MDHLDIVKRLCDNNCDTYIVGGGIRDMLLGNNPDDYDVVTEATPEKVIELFQDCKVKQVGRSFGVILVEGYEVATFRHDRYKGSKCIVSFADTIHDDLSRRDLTVNAMAFCELTGELIDDHGGKEDLDRRIIKFVGDADKRISEDPCRILRACRFLAKIDGTFDYNTFEALKKNANKYYVAPERIRLEILKAMKTKKASLFFRALKSIGMLGSIFPSLDKCWKHEHGPHHKEDVFDHCMYAGDDIWTRDPILKLAGYLHDVGKPISFKDNKFIGHETDGEIITREELKALTFSTGEIDRICGLINCHMNSILKMSPKAIRKLKKRLSDNKVKFEDFLRIRMADRKANLARENFKLMEWVKMYKNFYAVEEIPFTTHELALTGGEIIQHFDLKPGPQIGEIQDMLLKEVISRGQSINDKISLNYLVKDYLKKE